MAPTIAVRDLLDAGETAIHRPLAAAVARDGDAEQRRFELLWATAMLVGSLIACTIGATLLS